MIRMNRAAKQTALLVLALILAGPAASDERSMTDEGQLYVYGELQQSTCSLEMDSAYQEVDLSASFRTGGNLAAKASHPGTVQLYLRDCPEPGHWNANLTTSNEPDVNRQLPYRARIVAEPDASNPDLIAVAGAQGVGLRLKDSRGKTVRFSRTGATLLMRPDQNKVVFMLVPERNGAPFRNGSYHAVVNLSLIYL